MRYSDIQLLTERHWKKRSSSSSSNNFRDDTRYDSHRDGRNKHRGHDNDEHAHGGDKHRGHDHGGRNKKQHGHHSTKSRVTYRRPEYRQPVVRSSTTSRAPMEWNGNDWVDANSSDFMPHNTQSSSDLQWDGNDWSDTEYKSKSQNWNDDSNATDAELKAASDTQKMMHQNYELNKEK